MLMPWCTLRFNDLKYMKQQLKNEYLKLRVATVLMFTHGRGQVIVSSFFNIA